MKNFWHFCLFFVLISFFALFTTFVAEVTDTVKMQNQNVQVRFKNDGENLIMSWTPLPYPCTYVIETFSETSGVLKDYPRYHLMTTGETSEASYIVPRTPIPNFYRISARGIFTEIFNSEKVFANPNFKSTPRPIPIFHYTKQNPASLMPFLVWHTVPTAVCYELEILDAPPEIEGGIEHSEKHHLFSTTKIFTNGYQANLRPYQNYKPLYYRVRALTLRLEPIGEFCKAEPIFIDSSKEIPACPLINNIDFMSYKKLPIYPVYDWIPIHDGFKYEVELLDHPPKVENDVMPSSDSLWRQTTLDKSSCYDEYGRPYAGPYYWRVRALDENDMPIGTWSNTEKFVVDDITQGVYAVIFGDSISHGGGAVSYSPRSLEYSYATYLDFPAVNLSRSGDTSRTTLERFSQDILPIHPVNVIVSTGVNSLRDTSISADDIINDLKEINRLCLRNNIRPIFLTLTPLNPANIEYVFHTPTDPKWKEKMTTVNNFIKHLPYFIDIEPYFYDAEGNLSAEFSVDGIHQDIRGKMVIAEVINKHRYLFRNNK